MYYLPRTQKGALSSLAYLMVEIMLYRHLHCYNIDFELVHSIKICLKLNVKLRLAISDTNKMVKDTLKGKILVNVIRPVNVL